MVRILIAGLVGGLVLFMGGAFSHMALNLETRAFQHLPNEDATLAFVKSQSLEAGIYGFPMGAKNWNELTAEEKAIEEKRVNEAYRAGPSGFLIIGPTGEYPMENKQLIGEFVADVLAALLVAFIASHFSTFTSFPRRWLLIALIAPVAWLCLSVSLFLWDRYPIPFILDGLFAALIEWTMAGCVIAAIVRPIMHSR